MGENNNSSNMLRWRTTYMGEDPKIHGITFEDIWKILGSISRISSVQNFDKFKDDLLTHIASFENPHKMEIEDIKPTILEYLYNIWLSEGYEGDFETFKTLLFTEIHIGEYSDFLNVLDIPLGDPLDKTNLVTTLYLVLKYIEEHNESLDSHEVMFSEYFNDRGIIDYPIISIIKGVGVSSKYTKFLNKNTGFFENIQLDNFSSINSIFTTFIKFDISVNSTLMHISSDSGRSVKISYTSKYLNVQGYSNLSDTTPHNVFREYLPDTLGDILDGSNINTLNVMVVCHNTTWYLYILGTRLDDNNYKSVMDSPITLNSAGEGSYMSSISTDILSVDVDSSIDTVLLYNDLMRIDEFKYLVDITN